METEEDNSLFYLALENTLEAIIIGETDGPFVYANNAACELFGMTMQEIIEKGREGLADFSSKDVIEFTRRRKKDGKAVGTVEVIRKDGTKIPVEISAKIFVAHDGKRYTVRALKNISEKQVMEKALISSEKNLRSLIDSSDSSIWALDQDMRFIVGNKVHNDRFELLSGVKLQKGDKVTEHIPESIRAEWVSYYSKALRGDIFNIETNLIPPLKYKCIRYRFGPLKSIEGENIGLVVISQDLTDLKKTEIRLRNITGKLKKLTKRMEEVRDIERRTFANDLHDDLGQNLTALNIEISLIKAELKKSDLLLKIKLDRLSESVSSIIEHVREIASSTHPGIIESLGIVAALKIMLEKSLNKQVISHKIITSHDDFRVKPSQSIILYRIAQEAVTNIIRHSGASEILVELKRSIKGVEMVISDNGKGISRSGIVSHSTMGIPGMRERALSVGGKLIISRLLKGGTQIKVKLPSEK